MILLAQSPTVDSAVAILQAEIQATCSASLSLTLGLGPLGRGLLADSEFEVLMPSID